MRGISDAHAARRSSTSLTTVARRLGDARATDHFKWVAILSGDDAFFVRLASTSARWFVRRVNDRSVGRVVARGDIGHGVDVDDGDDDDEWWHLER